MVLLHLIGLVFSFQAGPFPKSSAIEASDALTLPPFLERVPLPHSGGEIIKVIVDRSCAALNRDPVAMSKSHDLRAAL